MEVVGSGRLAARGKPQVTPGGDSWGRGRAVRILEVKNQEGRPVIAGVCTVFPSVCEGKKKHKRRFPKMEIKPPFLPPQSLTPPTSQSQALEAQLCSSTIKSAPLWRDTFIHTLFFHEGGGESCQTTTTTTVTRPSGLTGSVCVQ